MAAKVVVLDCLTRHDIPPERVLQKALESDLEGVVVMGYGRDGSRYFASSYADGGTVLWLAERMKQELLAMEDGE